MNLLHGFAEGADGNGGDDLLPDQSPHPKENAPAFLNMEFETMHRTYT